MANIVGKRYAKALFDIAVEKNNVEQFYEEVKQIKEIIDDNPDLLKIIDHPHINKEKKFGIFKNSFKDNLSEDTLGFLFVIFNKNRDTELVSIINTFIELCLDYLGITEAEVVSAIPLSDDKLTSIKSKLEIKLNKKVNMNCTVDKSIIGGLIIRVDGMIVDGSVKYRLESIKKALYS